MNGDRNAFPELVARYRSELVRFFRRAVPEKAEDLAQECLLRLSRTRRYEPRGRLQSYVMRVAHTDLLHHLAENKRSRNAATIQFINELENRQPAERESSHDYFGPIVSDLRAALRNRLEGRMVEGLMAGMTIDGVAHSLGISASTVRDSLDRIREALAPHRTIYERYRRQRGHG